MTAAKKLGKHSCLVLSVESTIVNVEADARMFIQHLENCGTGKVVKIDASQVQEMDTAYLQLMRCIIKSASNKGLKIEYIGLGEPMKKMARLYGLDWDQSGA